MMYVKHFVICKALCTCVWVTALILVIILSLWDGIPRESGLGKQKGSSWDSYRFLLGHWLGWST